MQADVAYIRPKSRTERPKKNKIGTEVAHATRDSGTIFKVKRSKVKVTRPLYSPRRLHSCNVELGKVLTVGTYLYVSVCRHGGRLGGARRFGAHRRRGSGAYRDGRPAYSLFYSMLQISAGLMVCYRLITVVLKTSVCCCREHSGYFVCKQSTFTVCRMTFSRSVNAGSGCSETVKCSSSAPPISSLTILYRLYAVSVVHPNKLLGRHVRALEERSQLTLT